eukprot:TRINITY_DN5759_c0_g1_i1.p1 TRINITY_DN5759_c0_g1~~TRINITY_DN5759_c0_g1_i1.p1  ORF type:complete len:216 (+),score=12.19 TRINITY_DN5759_c0_g1_i1:118-765(+)
MLKHCSMIAVYYMTELDVNAQQGFHDGIVCAVLLEHLFPEHALATYNEILMRMERTPIVIGGCELVVTLKTKATEHRHSLAYRMYGAAPDRLPARHVVAREAAMAQRLPACHTILAQRARRPSTEANLLEVERDILRNRATTAGLLGHHPSVLRSAPVMDRFATFDVEPGRTTATTSYPTVCRIPPPPPFVPPGFRLVLVPVTVQPARSCNAGYR